MTVRVKKLANQYRMRDAERFALLRSPLTYEPSSSHVVALQQENEHMRNGLCPHGRIPRLVAERMSQEMGKCVVGCARCA